MSVYDIDYNAEVWQTLPVRLRQAVMYAWAKVVVGPVVSLAGLFAANRTKNLYVLAHNGQVCKMEGVLNDVFDPISRRIFISDPDYFDPLYLYLVTEDKPLPLGTVSEIGSTTYDDPQWLYQDSESYSIGAVQFIVNVPFGLAYDNDRMHAVIDHLRLPSKNVYSIVIF